MRARVCAVPYAYRLIEALAYGVVPVVLADEYVLPFDDVLDWASFAVHWPYSRATSLVPYLRTLSDARVCAMRRRARRAYERHFETEAKQVDTLLQNLATQQARGSLPRRGR